MVESQFGFLADFEGGGGTNPVVVVVPLRPWSANHRRRRGHPVGNRNCDVARRSDSDVITAVVHRCHRPYPLGPAVAKEKAGTLSEKLWVFDEPEAD